MSQELFQEYLHTRRYLESLGRLHRGRQWSRYPGTDGQGGVGLSRMGRLLEFLDHPERSLTFIHIGGTSGKGSVGRMVHAGLLDAGVAVGSYSSPHVSALLERIRLGSRLVQVRQLCEIIARLKPFVEREYCGGPFGLPTFHELLFAAALQVFRENDIQVAIVEVGVGGRLDSTNIIQNPLVVAITNVGLDHTELLGEDLRTIAWDKAKIIKPGCIAVTAADHSDALSEIEARAHEVSAPLWRLGHELRIGWDSRGHQLEMPDGSTISIKIGLQGDHQLRNAAVAVGVLRAAAQRGISVGELDQTSCLEGVFLPGRFEVIQDAAVPRAILVLDIAHNADKLKAMARTWACRFGRIGVGVVALALNKDARAAVPFLGEAFEHVIFTQVLGVSRPMHSPRYLMALAKAVGIEASVCLDPREAVRRAHSQGIHHICITGSTYLVGEVRNILQPESWVVGWREVRPVGGWGLARLLEP